MNHLQAIDERQVASRQTSRIGSALPVTKLAPRAISAISSDRYDEERERSVIITDEQMVVGRSPIDPSTIFQFGNRKYNLALLKQRAIGNARTAVSRKFSAILSSKEFDAFLKAAAYYTKWFIHVVYCERKAANPNSNPSSAGSVHESLAQGGSSTPSESAGSHRRTSIYSRPVFDDIDSSMAIEKSRERRNAYLKEFATAYCFLLLLISKNSMEPAKERAYFENIYAFTKEIVISIMSLPNHAFTMEAELNRLFRGHLFCGTDSQHLRRTLNTGRSSTRGAGTGIAAVVTKDLWTNTVASGISSRIGSSGHQHQQQTKETQLSVVNGIAGSAPSTGFMAVAAAISGAAKFKSKAAILGKLTNLGRSGQQKSDLIKDEFNKAMEAGMSTSALKEVADVGIDQHAPTIVGGVSETATAIQNPLQNEKRINGSRTTRLSAKKVVVSIRSSQRKQISLNDIRMTRSPLANEVLPSPQRYLFA